MEKSRIDVSKRLELVTNRLGYLNGLWVDIEREISFYTEERKTLLALDQLYSENESDPIDAGRQSYALIVEPPKIPKTGYGQTQQVIFSLLSGGKASTQEMSSVSGIPVHNIESCVSRLCKQGKLRRLSKGVYELSDNLKTLEECVKTIGAE